MPAGGLMKLSTFLKVDDIIPGLTAESKEEVLKELAGRVAERHPDLDRAELLKTLLERERLGSTGIGDGIAIPHGKLKRLEKPLLAFGRSQAGVDYNSLDGRKVNLLFLMLAPENAVGLHLKMLARISRILKDAEVRKGLVEAPDATAILEIIRKQDSY